MKWSDMAPNWPSHVPALLSQWPQLDENEVLATDGDPDRLAAHMAEILDDPASETRVSLDRWIAGLEPVDAVMDPTRDNARIFASRQDISPGEDPSDDDSRFGDDDRFDTPIGRS